MIVRQKGIGAPAVVGLCCTLWCVWVCAAHTQAHTMTNDGLDTVFHEGGDAKTLKTVLQWNTVNYTFLDAASAQAYIDSETYKSTALPGLKVSDAGHVFVCTPRWKSAAVPATFSRLVVHDPKKGYVPLNIHDKDLQSKLPLSPLLQPYPSWEANQYGEVSAFQSVLGFEIDNRNRLWVLDMARVASDPIAEGAAKLHIYDLSDDKLIRSYTFSDELVDRNRSFLNDLVIDPERELAYISDSGVLLTPADTGALYGGIIVYSFKSNTAWRVLSSVASTNDDPNVWVTINNEKVYPQIRMRTGCDGIALSPDFRMLYYTPLTSRTLWGIDTRVLHTPDDAAHLAHGAVQKISNKNGASDGMIMATNNLIYMTMIEWNALAVFDPRTKKTVTMAKNVFVTDDAMVWPDTISIDTKGNMFFTSDNLHHFFEGVMEFDPNNATATPNFRIWRVFLGSDVRSYVRSADRDSDTHKASKVWIIVVVFVLLLLLGFTMGYFFFCRKRLGNPRPEWYTHGDATMSERPDAWFNDDYQALEDEDM